MRYPEEVRRIFLLLSVIAVTLLSGCKSAFIETTIANRTAQPVSVVQMDYPSASFGTDSIAPGASFHYRFKVIGSGATKIGFTDSAHHDQHSDGPTLKEGDAGQLNIGIDERGVQWDFQPQAAR